MVLQLLCTPVLNLSKDNLFVFTTKSGHGLSKNILFWRVFLQCLLLCY